MTGSILVFDIETIPDQDLFNKVGIPSNKAGFPPCLYHQIITIGAIKANKKSSYLENTSENLDQNSITYLEIEYIKARMTKPGEINEAELLKKFFDLLEEQPILVSYNGNSFDIPALLTRARMHRVQAPYYYKAENKWENYTARYTNWHCDLLEEYSDGWNRGRYKLDDLCKILGLPGKPDGVDGSSVKELYINEEYECIEHYCISDVVNTYLLYLLHIYHKGELCSKGFNLSITNLIKNISDADLREKVAEVYLDCRDMFKKV